MLTKTADTTATATPSVELSLWALAMCATLCGCTQAGEDVTPSDAELNKLTLLATERQVTSEEAERLSTCRGCSVQPTDPLSEQQLHELLQRFAKEALPADNADYTSIVLDTLLFHQQQVRAELQKIDLGLPARHRDFLLAASEQHSVRLRMRVVDARGVVRGELTPRIMRFGEKTHVHFRADERTNLAPFEVSGTAVRVGLYHVWSRL